MKSILSATLLTFLSTSAFADDHHGDPSAHASSRSIATSTSGSATEVVQESLQPASPAFAPGLAAEDCMGSTSAGLTLLPWSVSGGTTWDNEKCENRHDAIALGQLGEPESGLALMSMLNEKVAAARCKAGHMEACVAAKPRDVSKDQSWPSASKAMDR